jgi:hypothetical protein
MPGPHRDKILNPSRVVSGLAGHRLAEATPFFERLCPAITNEGSGLLRRVAPRNDAEGHYPVKRTASSGALPRMRSLALSAIICVDALRFEFGGETIGLNDRLDNRIGRASSRSSAETLLRRHNSPQRKID